MKYHPRPIDTSEVELPADIVRLTELLARNAHENWAQQRLTAGWRHGAKRNDQKKEHPCLVPYDELPESEKEYDRKTAMETIKSMIALGYGISKSGGGA